MDQASPTIRAAATSIPTPTISCFSAAANGSCATMATIPNGRGSTTRCWSTGMGNLARERSGFEAARHWPARPDPRYCGPCLRPRSTRLPAMRPKPIRKELGLQRFVRHLIFVKPDVLIVADDILLDKPSPLELRFHPEQQAERLATAFVAKGAKAVLRIEPLSTDGVHVSGESLPLAGQAGREAIRSFCDPSCHAASRLAQRRRPILVSGRTGTDQGDPACRGSAVDLRGRGA